MTNSCHFSQSSMQTWFIATPVLRKQASMLFFFANVLSTRPVVGSTTSAKMVSFHVAGFFWFPIIFEIFWKTKDPIKNFFSGGFGLAMEWQGNKVLWGLHFFAGHLLYSSVLGRRFKIHFIWDPFPKFVPAKLQLLKEIFGKPHKTGVAWTGINICNSGGQDV